MQKKISKNIRMSENFMNTEPNSEIGLIRQIKIADWKNQVPINVHQDFVETSIL